MLGLQVLFKLSQQAQELPHLGGEKLYDKSQNAVAQNYFDVQNVIFVCCSVV
jgi:hypothetical protein